MAKFPNLSHWHYQQSGKYLDHSKLLMRTGSQVIMNDNMVLLAWAR